MWGEVLCNHTCSASRVEKHRLSDQCSVVCEQFFSGGMPHYARPACRTHLADLVGPDPYRTSRGPLQLIHSSAIVLKFSTLKEVLAIPVCCELVCNELDVDKFMSNNVCQALNKLDYSHKWNLRSANTVEYRFRRDCLQDVWYMLPSCWSWKVYP